MFSRSAFTLRVTDARQLLRDIAVWGVLASLVGVLVGTLSAFFLVLLESATRQREATPLIILGLPLVGVVIVWTYHHYGGSSGRGTALVVDNLNESAQIIPLRITPFVLAGTVFTHLFGGSAGREGTAVQMGASIAETLGTLIRLPATRRHGLLSAGIAAGFGAVFGTPVAGMVFALEVARVGEIRTRALLPALIGAFVGDLTVRLLGVSHTHYPLLPVTPVEPLLLAKVALAGAAFGLTGLVFVLLLDGIKALCARYLPYPPVRPFFGGLAVVALTVLIGTTDYNGLSVPLIVRSVSGGDVATFAFALKLLLTVITLGSGFVGGEVTPLFVIGATLGATLSGILNVEQGLLASIGFVAVFASASNTPLACLLMGIELFGGGATAYLAVGCMVAYLVSGHHSIYPTQRIGAAKSTHTDLNPDESVHGREERLTSSS